VGLADTLRRAGVNVTIASIHSHLLVTCSRKVKIEADALLSDCIGKSWDLIVLPGGFGGAKNFQESKELVDLLRQQRDAKKFFGGICASPSLVLAYHDLLTNCEATCYPNPDLQKVLLDKSSSTSESLGRRTVISQDHIITSQGPATTIEFALELVKVLCGKEIAHQVATAMIVPPDVLSRFQS